MKEVQWDRLEEAIDMLSNARCITISKHNYNIHRTAKGSSHGRYGDIKVGNYSIYLEMAPPVTKHLFQKVWVERVVQVLYDHGMLETAIQERDL